MITQDQTNQGYTSTQTQFNTSTPLRPTEEDQYEPPDNDSIIQRAGSAPTNQFATNATSATGRSDLWRRNNIPRTAASTAPHRMSTRPTGHNDLHNNSSPNSSDSRNGPTCFRCGEQGHMRAECRERVFCNHCKTYKP